jgi:glycosyltransferase involved in cell wall biosynthesis
MIHHCLSPSLSGEGGAKSYVEFLLNHSRPSISGYVLNSLKDIAQNQFELLHIHGAELLGEINGECPVVYTLHNHNPYCPSGTKYLTTSNSCCEREMSYLACTWGHLVDGCGSRRPENIVKNLQRSHWELETLKKLEIPIIANSDYVRNWLIRNNVPSDQVVTLRCGTSTPKITVEPLTQSIHHNQRILFAGRIVPNKGLNWLLQALTLTDRKIYLDIAGEGWDRPRMEQLANKLGLDDRITWHGWCDGEKLEALYQQCFSVVFPSLWPEPAGLITLEAYAHCRPVIASAVGGIPEHLRHGETGILVSANDVKNLVAAINELSSNYQKSRQIGEQGHTWFLEEFTLEVHVERLQKIYEKAVSRFHSKNKMNI